MLRFSFTKKKEPVSEEEKVIPSGFFSNDFIPSDPKKRQERLNKAIATTFQKSYKDLSLVNDAGGVGMDAYGDTDIQSIKQGYAAFRYGGVGEAQLLWYGAQGFIGFQTCAMLAQNWLIDKCCTIPARDAVRNGYELTINDGVEAPEGLIEALREFNSSMNIDKQMIEFARKGRIFGIRIALFVVDYDDPKAYEKPFNIDGVKQGSYKGISQIDPYWISPELDMVAATQPDSMHFYDPTYWRINNKRIHKSHLVIMRTNEVADVLKPSYQYAGVSIPQKIYERVYAAERTANEAPALAMTKRMVTLKIDMDKANLNGTEEVEERLQKWMALQNNFGVKIMGEGEEIKQIDTTLTDLDAVIMTQYNIVCAAANIPSTKVMSTQPTGFNATGEYEEASYREELEATQTDELTPLINRHNLLAMKSEIAPKFGNKMINIVVKWEPLDSPTAEELANVNKTKGETAKMYVDMGAVDGQDVRTKIATDPDSGFNGLDVTGDEDLGGESVQALSLAGQQTTAMLGIVQAVASGQIPRESGIAMLKTSFQLEDESAEEIMGAVGNGFEPAAPAVDPNADPEDDESGDDEDVATADAMDSADFDKLRGTINGAQLITTQSYLDPQIVRDKIDAKDYDVQVSPEFELKGQKTRVILDGHHSYAAAGHMGAAPVFKQMSRNSKKVKALNISKENFLRAAATDGNKYFNIATKQEIHRV